MSDASTSAARAADLAARTAYGRLLASLAVRTRDLASAEDALADAFVAALEQWPRDGVPERPEAWLLSTARRRRSSAVRRGIALDDALASLARALEPDRASAPEAEIPDERLRLFFACAHPAIDAAARTPLMLQVVLGLDAQRIAAAMCVAPKTMGQRLWRAKQKIQSAGIPLEVPAKEELGERLDAVLEAIYAAYGSGWDDVAGADAKLRGLGEEALWLARLAAELLPSEPEALGLHALLLYLSSRHSARRDAHGVYVPLSRQDPALWDAQRIELAERTLNAAAHFARPGAFQLEAAIQSAHVDARRSGRDVSAVIAELYDALADLAPTLGVLVSRAAAIGRAHGAERGLAALDALPRDDVRDYQPYWAVRAHLASRSGDRAAAREAYELAQGLSEDASVRAFLAAEMPH